jgi:hypothetical protein
LATYSEQADQYTKAGATIGSNVAVSPDGYTNADSIIEDSANSPHAFYNFSLTTFSAAAYTLSVYAKKGGRDWIRLSLYDGTAPSAYFNLNTGAIGTTSGVTAKIENYGSGWYRCSVTATMSAASGGIALYSASADGIDTYVGTNGLAATYVYGWQLELGAYATSYIPTLGTSVTRVAETAIKTSATALIGQTEGTIFLEFQKNAGVDAANIAFSLSDGTSDNLIYYNFEGPVIEFIASSVLQARKSGGINLVAGTNKIAVYYKANDFGIYLNGVSIFTDTTGSVGAMSKFNLGSFFNDAFPVGTPINQALLFKTRLTNAQLAELTTL